jgi:hypothetical protein
VPLRALTRSRIAPEPPRPIFRQLRHACLSNGIIDPVQLGFMLSAVRGIRPRDQLEVLHANQMVITHWLIMSNYANFAHRLAHQEKVDSSLSKLTRTYAMLMDTLKRYRTGGEQKVTVQHVSVNEGGQAIVANMTHQMGIRCQKNSRTDHWF